MTLQFRVNGIAQQMGSKTAFVPKGWTRPIITDSNKSLKSWQQLVADTAHWELAALPGRPILQDGVRLTVAFHLPRPKSLPKRVTAHCTAPDLDKLVRAIGDALSGVVYEDDRQVVDLVAMKRYALPGEIPYVDIKVEATAGVVPLPVDQPLFSVR